MCPPPRGSLWSALQGKSLVPHAWLPPLLRFPSGTVSPVGAAESRLPAFLLAGFSQTRFSRPQLKRRLTPCSNQLGGLTGMCPTGAHWRTYDWEI